MPRSKRRPAWQASSQRLLAGQGGAASYPQYAKAIAQAIGDGLDREAANARGGELERERDAVEALADRGHRMGVARRQREIGLVRLRTVAEQSYRFVVRQNVERRERIHIRHRKRWNLERGFAGFA